jgi:tRNA1Val (adenine37-N6)-methyltransferase
MFQFKQFTVDQSNCAMKINTDGVLLGAITTANEPVTILDIGTGTGVIALMLAQRFAGAIIDAVEIDGAAAETAGRNFRNSVFYDRLKIYCSDIGSFFDGHTEKKYDLIVSNPPFYINALGSPAEKKSLAKHTDASFFEMRLKDISRYMSNQGCAWLILPLDTASIVIDLIALNHMHLHKTIRVHSYAHSPAHRVVLCFGFAEVLHQITNFTIYKKAGEYSEEFKKLLQPYFLAF